MWQLIKDFLTSDLGSFGFGFGFISFILWCAVKAGKISEKFKVVDKLESNIDKIKAVDRLESNIDKIKDDISVIKAFINVNKQNNNSYAQNQSPIDLNDKGKSVSEKLKAKEIIHAVWDDITTEIKQKITTKEINLYTIQEVCFKIGDSYTKYFNEKDIEHIKKIAFYEGVALSSFDLLFGIVIRNRYFQENKISVEELDKQDANKKN